MGQDQKISLFLMFIISIGWTQGQEKSLKHYTSYGEPCKEACDKHGYEYFWCITEVGWDYCSKTEYTDYKYNSCRDDHRCGKYGKSYTWCYNKADTWGYCGLLLNTAEPKTLSYKSSKYQSECRDECLYDEDREYFWCNTDKGWDYCSPIPDVTYKNEPCRSDHYCGTHDYGYSWCWTNSGYDYCGVINPRECQYSSTGYNKDRANTAILVCTQWNRGVKSETKFYLEPTQTEIADGGSWRNELTTLISRWYNSFFQEYSTSHVVSTKNLHINLLGSVTMANQKYYQIEIESENNDMVAQVLVPVQNPVPSRYVRTALAESFRRRARISLKLTT